MTAIKYRIYLIELIWINLLFVKICKDFKNIQPLKSLQSVLFYVTGFFLSVSLGLTINNVIPLLRDFNPALFVNYRRAIVGGIYIPQRIVTLHKDALFKRS